MHACDIQEGIILVDNDTLMCHHFLLFIQRWKERFHLFIISFFLCCEWYWENILIRAIQIVVRTYLHVWYTRDLNGMWFKNEALEVWIVFLGLFLCHAFHYITLLTGYIGSCSWPGLLQRLLTSWYLSMWNDN